MNAVKPIIFTFVKCDGLSLATPGEHRIVDEDRPTSTRFYTPRQIGKVFVSDIQIAVARHYRINPSHMKSKAAHREVSHPRQVAMYLARLLADRSLPDIGRRFGGRDHTTVLYAIRAVKDRIESTPALAKDVELLIKELSPGRTYPDFSMLAA